jgi:hypothetical protein
MTGYGWNLIDAAHQTTHTDCFINCSSLNDIDLVPTDWGGLAPYVIFQDPYFHDLAGQTISLGSLDGGREFVQPVPGDYSGRDIMFTLDGSDPTLTNGTLLSTVDSETLIIDTPCVLKACVLLNQSAVGPIGTVTFTE